LSTGFVDLHDARVSLFASGPTEVKD
jgi:hypothetical protein